MACTTLEEEFAANVADDPGHDAERRSSVGEDRPLLDVQLEEGRGERLTPRDERAAPDAPDFLAAKHDHRATSDGIDRLYRRDHSESAVEHPSPRHRVEVRSDPHVVTLGRSPTDVSGGVPFDDEPGILHPRPRELVRFVFRWRRMGPVGTRPAADRVQLLESFHDVHEAEPRR